MKKRLPRAFRALLLTALGAAACALPRAGTGDDGTSSEASSTEPSTATDTAAEALEPVDTSDLVDLDELLKTEDDAAAAGAQVGEPATLLAEGRRQADKVRHDVGAVLGFVKAARAGAPSATGRSPAGRPWARWDSVLEGRSVRLFVERVEAGRLRYLVTGAADGAAEPRPLLTGVFLKKGPGVGGGRFHVSLGNVSDLFGEPNVNGAMHFLFVNHGDRLRGHRVLYRGVKDRGDAAGPVRNYGADLVRIPGEGGRLRTVGVADLAPKLPGMELFAARLQWRTGQGGRAAAIFVSLAEPSTPKPLATAHECWDAAGLRTAFASTPASEENPTAGSLTDCAGLSQEQPPEQASNLDGADADADLQAALDDVGATAIGETEAADSSAPDAP